MISKSKLVIAAILIVIASVAMDQVVSAAVTDSLLAAGTTRYAFVTAANPVSTSLITYSNLPGMSTDITIPPGKVGDVMILFCGGTVAIHYTMARARIGSLGTSPSEVTLREPGDIGGGENQCANFVRKGVPAGTHTVRIQWRGASAWPGETQWMYERNMIVVVNLH